MTFGQLLGEMLRWKMFSRFEVSSEGRLLDFLVMEVKYIMRESFENTRCSSFIFRLWDLIIQTNF